MCIIQIAKYLTSIHLGQVINKVPLKIKRKRSIFSYISDSQPNGNTKENCLTTFKPSNDEMPMWYDRPCIENDVSDEPGHKFMCECTVPDQQTGKDCLDNGEEIDIASLGERTTVICQNGNNDENEQPGEKTPNNQNGLTNPVQTTNPINNGNIGPQIIIQGKNTLVPSYAINTRNYGEYLIPFFH